jgi:hypothetical protein
MLGTPPAPATLPERRLGVIGILRDRANQENPLVYIGTQYRILPVREKLLRFFCPLDRRSQGLWNRQVICGAFQGVPAAGRQLIADAVID